MPRAQVGRIRITHEGDRTMRKNLVRGILTTGLSMMVAALLVGVSQSPALAYSGGGCRDGSGSGFTLRGCIFGITGNPTMVDATYYVSAYPGGSGTCLILWQISDEDGTTLYYGYNNCALGFVRPKPIFPQVGHHWHMCVTGIKNNVWDPMVCSPTLNP
jgi:hypothetical protein